MNVLTVTDQAGLDALSLSLEGILCNLRDDRQSYSREFGLLDMLHDEIEGWRATVKYPLVLALSDEQAIAAADAIRNAIDETSEASLSWASDTPKASHAGGPKLFS